MQAIAAGRRHATLGGSKSGIDETETKWTCLKFPPENNVFCSRRCCSAGTLHPGVFLFISEIYEQKFSPFFLQLSMSFDVMMGKIRVEDGSG